MNAKSDVRSPVCQFVDDYIQGCLLDEDRTVANTVDYLKRSHSKTLAPKEVFRLSEAAAFEIMAKLRWPDTYGEPICIYCGCERCYLIKTRRTFKCAGCRRHFSLTSQTALHGMRLQYRDFLAVLALFANNPKGIAALQISRDIDISYKSAFVLLHKIREAIDLNRSNLMLKGEVEIDGSYYGGYIRPSNGGREGKWPSRRRRKKCVLALVQRDGPTVTKVIKSENTTDVLSAAFMHILPGSVIYADEHKSYDALHARYETRRINHRWSYSDGIACTNIVESYNSRLRRAEIGKYHRISERYLSSYASECAYRWDRRRTDNGRVFVELLEIVLSSPANRNWLGYWQKRSD
ncbi:MAG: IS1595 family transposase [Alphaproteobacteria bacterium]|nr:IS1595 family transposase [Alphaproteobacteria bacterium]